MIMLMWVKPRNSVYQNPSNKINAHNQEGGFVCRIPGRSRGIVITVTIIII